MPLTTPTPIPLHRKDRQMFCPVLNQRSRRRVSEAAPTPENMDGLQHRGLATAIGAEEKINLPKVVKPDILQVAELVNIEAGKAGHGGGGLYGRVRELAWRGLPATLAYTPAPLQAHRHDHIQ